VTEINGCGGGTGDGLGGGGDYGGGYGDGTGYGLAGRGPLVEIEADDAGEVET